MTSALIFSRDRACQLDLLLRSVTCHAPELLESIVVLWRSTSWESERAYDICMEEHQDVRFVKELSFFTQTLDLLDESDEYHTFFTDDSVIYRSVDGMTHPASILRASDMVLCFSLRLGQHAGTCYSLSRLQGLPKLRPIEDFLVWEWRTGDADWGYMGSLDGHFFRKDDLLDWLDGTREFSNPNQLEDVLAREVAGSIRQMAACYERSRLVGVPVNRVNETHPNRFGEFHMHDLNALNDLYLEGRRISLDSIKADRITAVHAEMELDFV